MAMITQRRRERGAGEETRSELRWRLVRSTPHPGCLAERVWTWLIAKELSFWERQRVRNNVWGKELAAGRVLGRVIRCGNMTDSTIEYIGCQVFSA